MPKYIEERIYFPDGMDFDDYDAPVFQVGVFYRGNGKYVVADSKSAHRQVTHKGTWLFCPAKMTQMRWCRFSFEEACRLAERVVNTKKVNGLTFAEWEARKG